jgi:phosphoribosylformimino-5-aminoimidazole carboxamide ribotide isomerase
MDVIPVLDLKGGIVVRGIGGRRAEYQPLVSTIAQTPEPREVAMGLVRQFGFQRAYVADLDAIAGSQPNCEAYRAIEAAGLALWIDAGAGDINRARAIAARCASVVIGLESLDSPAALVEILDAIGEHRAVFSLDLMRGRPLTRIDAWKELSPLAIAGLAVAAGVRHMIVLDLASVGTSGGPSILPLGDDLRQLHPDLKLIGGGGVRHADDLAALASAGYSAALVASAIYDGRITR